MRQTICALRSSLKFTNVCPAFERPNIDVPYSDAWDYLNWWIILCCVGLSATTMSYFLHLIVYSTILLTIR
jgi:hypothetical protein